MISFVNLHPVASFGHLPRIRKCEKFMHNFAQTENKRRISEQACPARNKWLDTDKDL